MLSNSISFIYHFVTNMYFSCVLGEEYIKSLIGNPELVDHLALSNDDKVNT